MIDPKVIRSIADEAILQITMGCKAYRSGDMLSGELHMSMGQVALLKLQRLADAELQKPLRVLAIVGPRDEDGEPLPAWMGRKANDGGDGNGAA